MTAPCLAKIKETDGQILRAVIPTHFTSDVGVAVVDKVGMLVEEEDMAGTAFCVLD